MESENPEDLMPNLPSHAMVRNGEIVNNNC
jgi:hypothetical protein